MSYKKFDAADIKSDGFTFTNVEYFIADAEADIANLPGLDDVAFGSMCACLENGSKYVLRESGEWVKYGE